VFDKSARTDGTFSRDEFRYDARRDIYLCPGGTPMHTSGTLVNDGATLIYRASKHDCGTCALKPRCCPKDPARKVSRSIHEGARDLARDLSKTDAWLISRRERKKVEMLFAHLKRILKLDRLRLRGPLRCSRRVPSRRSRPEPPQNGQADRGTEPNHCLKGERTPLASSVRRCLLLSEADFFNSIGRKQTLATAETEPTLLGAYYCSNPLDFLRGRNRLAVATRSSRLSWSVPSAS
jgi:hypothetical protein